MAARTVSTATEINGVRVPTFLYGTAWKEDATQRHTEAALRAGFRGIDTANQRRHYFEAGVGAGLVAMRASGIDRASLFLQTKFTSRSGQDHRLPYDPAAPVELQVEQSFNSSLEHLDTDYIDAYVLHGPEYSVGLCESDWQAWRAMEALHRAGRTRLLGVSNVSRAQLEELCTGAEVPPAMVQNRCFASRAWDAEVREFCTANGLGYQGFSLLTANRKVWDHPELARIARRQDATAAQVLFRFSLQLGMIAMTGTTDEGHMAEDLAVYERIELTTDEVATLETLARR